MIRVKNLKKDYRGGGLERWRSVVDAFPLADITTQNRTSIDLGSLLTP
jgi:hypothetical protein